MGRAGRVVLVALLVAVASVPFLGADESSDIVAEELYDAALKQFRRRAYHAALSLVAKTLSEAPGHLAAHELKGQVFEKLGRLRDAEAAYEDWLAAYETRAADGTLDKSHLRDRKNVVKRLEKIREGPQALAVQEASLEADLKAFLATWAEKAPQAAARAQAVVDAMGQEAEAPPEDGEMSRLYRKLAPPNEIDLVSRRTLGRTEGLTYGDEGGLRLLFTDGGTILQPSARAEAGTHYIYEMHMEVTPKSGRWLSGLVFGIENNLERFLAAFVNEGKLHLHRVAEGGRIKEDVAVKRLDTRAGELRVLSVVVEGRKVEVYVDGRKEISWTASRVHRLDGSLGVWVQDAVVDVPQLRLGRLR